MDKKDAFRDLLWAEVEAKHSQKWTCICDFFGFEGKGLLDSYSGEPSDVLRVLAENCVHLCYELLFSLEPIENLKDGTERYGDTPDFSSITAIRWNML